jgi:hypothetical protein
VKNGGNGISILAGSIIGKLIDDNGKYVFCMGRSMKDFIGDIMYFEARKICF